MIATPHTPTPIVIWFGRIGDMIMLSAILDILHRRYGQPCAIVGAGAWTEEIYRSHPDVAQVWCLGRHRAFFADPSWWRAMAALRRRRAAPVYVCETDPRKLRRIRRLLAWSGIAASHCVFMEDALAAAQGRGPTPEHWVDRLVALGRCTPPAFSDADFPWPQPPPRCAPLLAVTAPARSECEAWLAAKGWRGRPLVLVQPGNQRMMRGGVTEKRQRAWADDHKAWPVERWAALLRHMEQRMPQAVLFLVGAPQEAEYLECVRAEAKLASLNIAALSLTQLFALCAVAHSMISVDTGPAHAAAAVGLPLVVLFGGYSPRVWQPRSALGSPVLGVGGPPVSSRLDQVPEEAVLEAWCRLVAQLDSTAGSAAATAPDCVQSSRLVGGTPS